MKQQFFVPGFRCSVGDGLVLICGAVIAIALSIFVCWQGIIVGFVVSHFFLFCNVVRLSRPLELLWSGVFVAFAGATIVDGLPGWGTTFIVSGVTTVVVILLEIRKPSYHGIGWKRINPGLPIWLKAHPEKQTKF